MIQNGRFLLMNREEFLKYMMDLPVKRTVTSVQNHHTILPDYKGTTSSNQIALVVGMMNYHVRVNKMADLAQHLSTFKDGLICTGRPFDLDPAGIFGANHGAICIENVGNFDLGNDIMTDEHKLTILFVNAVLAMKFNIPINTEKFIYHHWFNLETGGRTNGYPDSVSKSCPGTNFFGGNMVPDADKNFIPLVMDRFLRIKYPGWQVDCAQFLVTRGLTESIHLPDEVISIGTFGYMMNNFFDKREYVDPVAYLAEKGIIKDPHKANELLTLGTLGYILMNTEGIKESDPIAYLTRRRYITGKHTSNELLTIWLFGAVINSLMVQKAFQLSY